jgi:hypothetical protein
MPASAGLSCREHDRRGGITQSEKIRVSRIGGTVQVGDHTVYGGVPQGRKDERREQRHLVRVGKNIFGQIRGTEREKWHVAAIERKLHRGIGMKILIHQGKEIVAGEHI